MGITAVIYSGRLPALGLDTTVLGNEDATVEDKRKLYYDSTSAFQSTALHAFPPARRMVCRVMALLGYKVPGCHREHID